MLCQEEEQIAQRIFTVKSGFHKVKDRSSAFNRVLRDYYEHLCNSDSSTQEYIAKSLTTLHSVLNQPELVEQDLLLDYISEVIRFVGNVGLGLEFGQAFIDRAIRIYKQAGYPLTNLYLVKARFLPVNELEHPDRESVFLEARSYAVCNNDQEGLVRVLLALSEYYTGVSQYRKSIDVCKECEKLTKVDNDLLKYYPSVLTNLGITYFTLLALERARFYLLQAEGLLTQELTEQSERGDQYFGKRVLGTVLHYLGRDAEMRGDLQKAMYYYVAGHKYQQLGSEDLDAIAFYHLRMGELLSTASLVDQACDHLRESQTVINTIVIAGTASIQVRLAWTAIYSKEGNYEKAREAVKGAQEEARQKHTSRIELRCLLKLFHLEIRHLQLHHVIYTAFQIMKTGRDGELRRGGVFRFVKRFVSLKFLWRLSHLYLKGSDRKPPLSTCTCPIHLSIEAEKR